MQPVEVLRELSDGFGVAGFEDEVREKIVGFVSDLVDEVRTDPLGNLFAIRRAAASGADERTLMLDAHMDEVGFIVKWIDENGYLRFAPIGGWDERIVPGHRVVLLTRDGTKRDGVIGTAPPHIVPPEERKKPIPMERMFVDVGALSKDEVVKMGIRIGDPLTIHYPFTELRDGCVTGKAFDDRAGCTVLIEVARRLAEHSLGMNVAFSFVFGEEVGLRGARTAAYQLKPDLAIAIEGTIGADMPGVPPESQPVRLGLGPAISVADRSIIVSPKVVAALETVAENASIPYQYKLPTYGGTDAGAIHLTRGGVLAGVISVPCRYIHSPISTLRLDDLENTIRLTRELVDALPDAIL
jgi:putative aminopeptidase FrvX